MNRRCSILGKDLMGYKLGEINLVNFSCLLLFYSNFPEFFSREYFTLILICFLIVFPMVSVLVLKIFRYLKFKLVFGCIIIVILNFLRMPIFTAPKDWFENGIPVDYTYFDPIVQKRIIDQGVKDSIFDIYENYKFHGACAIHTFRGKAIFIMGRIKKTNKLNVEGILLHELHHLGTDGVFIKVSVIIAKGIIFTFILWKIYSLSKTLSTNEMCKETIFIYLLVVLHFSFIMPWINLVVNIIQQIREVNADLSAKNYHYEDHLINELYIGSKTKQLKHTIPFSLLYHTHPCTFARIQYLSK